MTTQQIADRLVELCRTGQFEEAYTSLFSQDASSHEAPGVPDGTVVGLDNMLAKSKAWGEDMEAVHEMTVTDPFVYDNFISVGMYIDVEKKDGTREKGSEICLYEVKDGKIISERFFYQMPG
ncbi:SnoaL-like domain-containing protein [Lewinella sp. W8]|uniref:SnoaL-like domain-containing protein n=1 Tax=Lewinella sp. W8 TaxID=2528208 RepID=UPI0010679BF6|nr:SnoaL-like domain-containing protein [Lewinella sp. W8]MTB53709.1 nuclear transport factor 2 family protein [Lewinella sp. W8]